MDIFCVVYVVPDIYIFNLKIKDKVSTDVDTMCINTWLIYTRKACVPHYQILI